MAVTNIRGSQILNNTVQRQDLDVSTVGQAVVTKIIQGSGATLSSTGADAGTGDVTVTVPNAPGGFIAKTAAYTLTSTDSGKYVICSGGSWTLTLPAPVVGLTYRVRNDMGITFGSTTGTITIAPTGGTIDGASSLALLPQQECTLITDGTNWRTFGLKRVVVLGTQDITTAVASSNILLPAGYRMFELEFDATMGSTGNPVNFYAVFSTDGGSTWMNTGQYYWVYVLNSSQSALVVNGNVSQNFAGFGNMGSVATYCKCHVKLFPGSATGAGAAPNWIAECGAYSSGAGGVQRFVVYGVANSGRINALQYYPNTGNIASSFLTVKGIV